MKSMIVLLIMILFISVNSFADPGDTLWTRHYSLDNYNWASCVRQTNDEGYIIAGTTAEANNFYALTKILIMKTDNNGNLIWLNTFGDSTYRYSASSIIQTPDEGYIVIGRKQRPLGGAVPYIFSMKLNSYGDTVWTKTYLKGIASSVQPTNDNCFIIGGGTVPHISYPPENFFILIKIDNMGDTLWTKTYTLNNNDRGQSAQQTAEGGYIIAGSTIFSENQELNANIYVVKADSIGDSLWTRTYGFGGGPADASLDAAYYVDQTNDGNYIISGYTYRNSNYDFLLMKINADGDTLWARDYGGSSKEKCRSACQTMDGGLIMTGFTESYGAGDKDVWVVRTDPYGVIIWTNTCGGILSDDASFIEQTLDYHYIVTGTTHSFGPDSCSVYLIKLESGFVSDYSYLPGDANMATGIWPPQVIGSDVTYLISYFRGVQPGCLLDGFYCSGDANGDCVVIGSDVTRLVSYFRGNADIVWCPDYPPAWLTPDDLPVDAPDGWPNCE